MLFLIGLGLCDERDISVRGLEVVKRASRVYLEAYTAILLVNQERLESYYERKIILADREMVESDSETILSNAATEDVAFLVVGDPFSATTHADLVLRAREQNIPYRVIHNASILTAVGATGLQLYAFGQTVSMVFYTENWRPSSWYDRVAENATLGLHTLILLDIKVKEPDLDALVKGRKGLYLPPRFMTVQECVEQMLETEAERKDGICGPERLAVGVARAGAGEEEKIVSGTLQELVTVEWGEPLHSVVLCGKRMHEMEMDFLKHFAVDGDTFEKMWKRDYNGS